MAKKPTPIEPLAPAPPEGAYAPMISIDIRHDYCNASGGRYEGIELAPTPVTARRLARSGLLLRERSDGVDLFFSRGQRDALSGFMASLPAPLLENALTDLFGPPMLFTMRLKSQLFFNYTEVPTGIRSGKPALLLSNRRTEIVEERVARLKIDWDSPAGTLAPHAPPVVSPPPRAAPAPDAKPQQMPPTAHERLEREARALLGDEASKAVLEPFSGWWSESRGEVAEAQHEQANLQWRSRYLPFGLIKIFAMPPGGKPAASGDWNGYPVDPHPATKGAYLRPTRYLVQFPARATYWRYWIASRGGGLDHDSLAITDPAKLGGFGKAEPAILPDGTEARCFTATRTLPLKQRPEAAFGLEGRTVTGGTRPRELIKRLPAPTADSILPDPHPPPGRIRSDIYVFV